MCACSMYSMCCACGQRVMQMFVPVPCFILSVPWNMSTSLNCQNTVLLIFLAHVDLVYCMLLPLQDSTGEDRNLPRALLWSHHG